MVGLVSCGKGVGATLSSHMNSRRAPDVSGGRLLHNDTAFKTRL